MAGINQPNPLNSPMFAASLILSLKYAPAGRGIISANLRRTEVTRFEELKELVHAHDDYGHIISLFG
jgi:hypothetical protein